MTTTLVMTRRAGVLLSGVVIWMVLGASITYFALGHVLSGAISAAVTLLLVLVTIDGRLIRPLEGRPLPTASVMLIVAAMVLAGAVAVNSLLLSSVSLLGKTYWPGAISVVKDIGTLVLVGVVAWEIIARKAKDN